MTKERFDLLLIGMVALAAVVFAALYFVRAGYGLLRDGRWGPKIDNRIGWILMEAPVFLAMTALCLCSPRRNEAAPLVFFALFQLHYLHRAFIYPMLFKSRSAMPLGIVAMGIAFNLLNACMQGGWIFYVAPEGYYTNEWLLSPQSSPERPSSSPAWRSTSIRTGSSAACANRATRPTTCLGAECSATLRRPTTSARSSNGPGFAILTWSASGAVFALWTFANLVPRADAIYKRYAELFGDELRKERRKRVIPFIY